VCVRVCVCVFVCVRVCVCTHFIVRPCVRYCMMWVWVGGWVGELGNGWWVGLGGVSKCVAVYPLYIVITTHNEHRH
jgi:hypothetical protein